MLLVSFLHPTPTDPEIVVLRLSDEEHDEFHKDPLGFVNKHKIFGKDVSRVDVPRHTWETSSASQTKALALKKEDSPGWLVVLVHQLSCTATGACFTA